MRLERNSLHWSTSSRSVIKSKKTIVACITVITNKPFHAMDLLPLGGAK